MARRLFLLLFVGVASAASEICLSGDSDPYLYFGDKTAYTFANRGLTISKTHDVPGFRRGVIMYIVEIPKYIIISAYSCPLLNISSPIDFQATGPLPPAIDRSPPTRSSDPHQVVGFSPCSTFFIRTAKMWNSLPGSVFPDSYKLVVFKSRDKRFLLGCSPIAFWLLYRHGSTHPEANEIKQLQELEAFKANIIDNYKTQFNDIDERICNADRSLLEQWKWDPIHNATFAGDITGDGYMSTEQIAQAWRQKYPGLVTLNTYNYLFKLSPERRSLESFRAFTAGLFGAQADSFDIPKVTDEKIANPYKSCPKWKKDVEENNETYSQRHIFETKLDYRQMITAISRRLGFKYDIHRDVVNSMYQMCRYDKAWDVAKISPWCAVFTKEDLKRLEYAEDLETYYKYGYGQPLHNKLGCLPVKDMFTFFSNHISKEIPQLPLSMVTITTAPMLLATLSTLNTHWDSAPPTGDNFNFLNNGAQARKWTTSTMAPYNGNIAAVLYKCTPNGNFQVNSQYQVLFLENEKPMYLEGCRVGLCDWNMIKNRFADLVTKCDMEFCNGAGKLSFGVSLALIAFVVSRFSVQM